MMNIPGNIIRGAGSVVGGTVSAVASVTGVGRKGELPGDIVVKEKTVLTVKETPNKDAQTTAGLSILTGYLTKKNEQGMWQKRFCCLVPHMFLYYFDNDISESPRGIIDLEYFTDIDIQNQNILKIATSPRISSRGFYFQIDDPQTMSQWMASMHRDRYMVVRDERDAYQQLQDQFSGQMDFLSKLNEDCSAEKDKLSQEVSKNQKLLDSLVSSIQEIFQTISKPNEDINTITKVNIGEMTTLLVKQISEMKIQYESNLGNQIETTQKDREQLESKIEQLEKQIAAESYARRLLETQHLQEKRDAEVRLREAATQIEKSNQNYQAVWNLKSSFEEKLSTTSEQKRVLIKEVKTLRKKVDEVSASNEQLRGVNDTLESAILGLQNQLESQKIKYENLLTQQQEDLKQSLNKEEKEKGEEVENSNSGNELNKSDDSNTTDLVQNALKASLLAKQHKGYGTNISVDNEELSGPDNLTRSHTDSPHNQSRTSRHGSIDPISTSILPPPPLPVDLDGNVIEWDPESREKMLQMDWLSPEQRNLLQDRRKEEFPSFEHHNEGSGRKLSIVQMTSNLFHFDKSNNNHTETTSNSSITSSLHGLNNSTTTTSTTTTTTTITGNEHEHLERSDSIDDSKISFRRLSALFHSSNSSESKVDNESLSKSEHTNLSESNHSTNQITPSLSSPSSPTTTSTLSSVPTCYRCGGTVEGPKYSTCKCDIPQMTPITEDTSKMNQFKGFFMKAKKAGSTLLKNKNEENLTNTQSSDNHPHGIDNSNHSSPFTATKKKMNLLSLDENITTNKINEVDSTTVSTIPFSSNDSNTIPDTITINNIDNNTTINNNTNNTNNNNTNEISQQN